jgi:hypothetical protein
VARPSFVALLLLPASLAVAQTIAPLSPPTGERDLVVFIARNRPELYRLIGQQPVPYGTARFESPLSMVADPARRCFYVFDEPARLDAPRKIWRIDSAGAPALVFQGHLSTHGGPFSRPLGIGLDETGRLLVADAVSGLWRLEAEGRLQRLLDGRNKPLHKISAATATPRHGLIVATSYQYEIAGGDMLNLPDRRTTEGTPFNGSWSPAPSGEYPASVPLSGTGVANSSGRQVPIAIWHNQGGLFRLTPADRANPLTPLVVNQRPGGQEYDTYWRTAACVFVDSAGRIVLVDAGSARSRSENVYTGVSSDYPQQRKTTSFINGGVFLLHMDGRFEDLTYGTPAANSGPMRRPTGAAQWSDDAYIVADPELYVPGLNGAGGLLLLKLDGSRDARWPFGYRLKPVGVAVLRGAGSPAVTQPAIPMSLARLAGVHVAGPVARIENVSLERKPQPQGGGMLPPLIVNWDRQSAALAEQRLRQFLEGARWSIAPDGSLRFAAKGVPFEQEGTPLVMAGKIAVFGQVANASAAFQRKTVFDTRIGSLDARLLLARPDLVTMNVTVNLFTNEERLKATFEQSLPLARR